MHPAHIAPFIAHPTTRAKRRARLLPLFLGLGALPLASAHAQKAPVQAPVAPSSPTPEPTLSRANSRSVVSKISAPAAVAPATVAPAAVAPATVAPATVAPAAVAPAAVAPAAVAPAAVAPATVAPAATAPIRLAQLTPKDRNAPATPPEAGPRVLKGNVGPELPNTGTPAAPPPDDSTPPPRVTPPPGTLDVTPDQPAIIGDVNAAVGREISDVKVVGNRVVPADTILAQAHVQRGAAFSIPQVQNDIGLIGQLGFFATVQAEVDPDLSDPSKVTLTYIVAENRVITGFKFLNNGTVKPEELTAILKSKVGTVLNFNTFNEDVQAIQNLYRDKGFAALVQARGTDQAADGTLIFNIQQATISQINIIGLKKTNESLVRRQIRTKTGETYNETKLNRDLNRLQNTGFFDAADKRVDNDPDAPGQVIVNFVLREKDTGQVGFGVGFDSRSRISGFLTLSESNLRGTGQRGFASIEAGAQRNFQLGTGNSFIGDKNASYDVSIYRRSIFRQSRIVNGLLTGNTTGDTTDISGDNTFTYEEQRTGGRVNFTRPLDYDRHRTLIFGYRNENAQLRQRDNTGALIPVSIQGNSLNSTGTVSAASIGFLRDSRDIQVDPSSGGIESLVVEKAFKFLGGNTDFTKLDLDLRRYIPLIRGERLGAPAKLVAAGRLVLGRSINQLPPFEQYYIGGPDTVRGYNTDQQFGDNQLYGNAELRYRFQRSITGVLFVDSGTAYGGRFSSGGNLSPLTSVGVGVRLVTPIGPIRLDYGFGRNGGKVQFGIGPTF